MDATSQLIVSAGRAGVFADFPNLIAEITGKLEGGGDVEKSQRPRGLLLPILVDWTKYGSVTITSLRSCA